MNIADIRVDYTLKSFDESDLEKDPFDQFKLWFDEALKAEVMEPNAMTLATIAENGFPAARIVLLKGIEENGLVFFTNFESNKGVQLARNNKAALVFFWPELQRQVRIVGHVAKIQDEQSDLYFNSRPLGSRIGAHASPQSKIIPSRKLLEESVKKMEALFAKEPLLRPTNWGGYIVKPISFEFWQGRSSRLHDRFLFELGSANTWNVNRLAP